MLAIEFLQDHLRNVSVSLRRNVYLCLVLFLHLFTRAVGDISNIECTSTGRCLEGVVLDVNLEEESWAMSLLAHRMNSC